MALLVMPDVLALVREYLAGVSELTALVPIERITTRSPQDTSTPWVRLSRTGGPVVHWQWLDRCNLQSECYAPPDSAAGAGEHQAFLVARTLRAAYFALNAHGGGFVGSDGIITGAEDQLGLLYQPDTSRNPPTPRVVMAVSIYARPKE